MSITKDKSLFLIKAIHKESQLVLDFNDKRKGGGHKLTVLAWDRIHKEFNKQFACCKSVKSLQEHYKKKKGDVKKETAFMRRYRSLTGGGGTAEDLRRCEQIENRMKKDEAYRIIYDMWKDTPSFLGIGEEYLETGNNKSMLSSDDESEDGEDNTIIEYVDSDVDENPIIVPHEELNNSNSTINIYESGNGESKTIYDGVIDQTPLNMRFNNDGSKKRKLSIDLKKDTCTAVKASSLRHPTSERSVSNARDKSYRLFYEAAHGGMAKRAAEMGYRKRNKSNEKNTNDVSVELKEELIRAQIEAEKEKANYFRLQSDLIRSRNNNNNNPGDGYQMYQHNHSIGPVVANAYNCEVTDYKPSLTQLD